MNFNSMTKQQLIEEIRRRDQRLKELQNGDQVRVAVQRLSALIAHLPGGIILETPERKVMQVNRKFCEIFGIDAPPEALQGADCRQAAQQAKSLFIDEEGFVTRIDNILAAGKRVLNEELYLRDGRVFERDYVPVEVGPGQVEHLWHYRDVTDRKKSAQALKEAHKLLQDEHNIFTSGPVVVFKWQNAPGWPVEYVSTNVEEVFGYTAKEFISGAVSYAEIIPKEDISGVAEEVKVNSESGAESFHHRPYRIIRKDGQPVWLLDYTIILRNEGGEVTHYLGYVVDITRQKQDEKQFEANLRQTELLYQLIERLNLANSLQEIYAIAVEGIIDLMKCDRSAILLFEDDGKVHFKAWKNLSAKYRRAVDGHSPWQAHETDAQLLCYGDVSKADFGEKIKSAMGREGIGALLFMPLKGADRLLGKFMVYFNAPRECNEQEQYLAQILAQNLSAVISRMQVLEQALRLEQKYRSIFDNALDGIYQSTPQGCFITVNSAMVKMFGYKNKEEMLALENTADLYWDAKERRRLVKLANSKQVLSNVEVKMRRADGSLLWVLMNDRAVKDAIGKTLYYEGTLRDITERKQAEQELRASEERYRTLFNLLPYGGEVLDRNGMIINLSPSTARMLGYKPEEMLGRPITEFIDVDSRKIFKHKFPELLKGRPQTTEIRLIRKDGVPLNIMRAATPVFDKSGQVASILALSVDITERVRAEEKIAELAAFNQNIVESAPVGIVTVDVRGKVTSANKAFMQMMGSPGLEETLKLGMNIPSVQKAGLLEAFKKTIAGGESFELKNIPYASHWGKELVVNVKGVAQKIRAGQISGIIIVVDDVTRSVLAEREMQKSEAKFRAIAQTASDAIVSADSSGNIMLWNRGAQQIFGYREDEVLGKPLTLLMPQRFKEDHIRGFSGVAAGGQTHLIGKTVEVAGIRKSGEEIPIELSLAKWEIGEELYFSALIRDISERKLAEAELLWSKQQQETINALLQIPLTEGSLKAKLDAAVKVIVKTPLLALQEKGAIFLTDGASQNLILHAAHNMPDSLLKMCALVPYGHCLCGLAAATRQLQFAGCVDERHTNQYAGMHPHGHYNVPILSGEKLLGVLVLYLPENYQEKENDKIFLRAAANTLASVIEYSLAKDTLEQQLTFSQVFSVLSQQIILEQERQNLLEGMARIAGETLGVDRSLIYEIDLEKREARDLCEWLNPRAGKIIPTAAAYPLDIFKKSEKRVTTSRRWLESHAHKPNRLFIAEGSDKILHEQMQIKSLLWYPFAFKENTYYLLVFNYVREFHEWLETELDFVSSLTRLVDMGLMKLGFLEEQARMTSELRRLAAVVEQANETVVLTDPQGNIEYVNPAFEQLSGYSFRESLGKNPKMLKSGRQNEELYKNLWRTILSGQAWSGTLINKCKDGSLYDEEAIVFPIKNDAGQIIHFCKIARDVSKERQLEEQLRRSQKLETIGTLAGGIAHDFNNILTPILGYADMALLNLKEADPLYHDLQQVLKAAHRAKDLVAQILLFAKQSEKEREPLALQPLIKEALKLLRPSIPATVQIQKLIDPTCEKVLADASQIHQVVVNLCTNAWQSMEEKGGTLTIELKQAGVDAAFAGLHPHLEEGEYAILTIADSGCGMDETTLEHIFDPFFTTKAVDKGTGLGLSVVHGIVRSHKGDVFVESEPGKGSAFHMYLPVYKAGEKKAEDRQIEITGGQESVLLVDDDELVANLSKTMLERLGYKVDLFKSGIEGLKAFRARPEKYDLLISDLTMPNMTGLDLAGQLQKIRPGFPMMIMTGYGESLNEDTRRTYGIKQVIGKPMEMTKLAAAVRQVLDKKYGG